MPRLSLPPIERIPGGRTFAALSRRVRTLIVAGVLFVVLFILALVMPVPYVVLSPGPTYNTLGIDPRSTSGDQVVVLEGKKPNKTSGHLNMTTVSEQDNSVSAFQALIGWLRSDRIVLPRAAVIPPGTSQQQQNQQNASDFAVSQDSATVAALCELGYPKAFGVVSVVPDGPSHGILQVGDQLVSVDGAPTASESALLNVLAGIAPGTSVPVVVKRQGKTATLQVKVGKPPAVKGQAAKRGGYLGISPSNTCLAPFSVSIHLEDIGGPSAGLMFALAIIDKAGPDDLTKGRFIAGTGEIDPSDPEKGEVDPIGGIALKMIAARDEGATVFLAPAGNCSTVRQTSPSGLKVIKVTTVRGAVQDLLKLQKGEPVPSC